MDNSRHLKKWCQCGSKTEVARSLLKKYLDLKAL